MVESSNNKQIPIEEYDLYIEQLTSLAVEYGINDLVKTYFAHEPKPHAFDMVPDYIISMFQDILYKFANENIKDCIICLDNILVRINLILGDPVEKDGVVSQSKILNIVWSKELIDFIPKEPEPSPKLEDLHSYTLMTKEDAELLSNYVTNVEGDIYAFKNLPEEVTAVILAYVSRSPYSFKENLLKLLKSGDIAVKGKFPVDAIVTSLQKYLNYEVASNYKSEYASEEVNNLESLIEQIKNLGQGDVEQSDKVSKFHEKWILGYSHSSVSELATIKIGIDKISILATKELEDNRLGSYIEKSTRYQQFDGASYHIPDFATPDLSMAYCTLMDYIFNTYNGLFKPVKEQLQKLYPRHENQKEKPYLASIHAKACDILRYLLPTSTLTSMGLSFNARTMAHAVSKLLSNPLDECVSLGNELKKESLKVCPTLIKYATANTYRRAIQRVTAVEGNNVSINVQCNPDLQVKPFGKQIMVSLTTPVGYQDFLNLVCSSIAYEGADCSLDEITKYYKYHCNNLYKINTIDDYVSRRSDYDSISRVFESIPVTFDCLTDYGAYRDVQRHRLVTHKKQLLTTKHGYSLHPDTIKLSIDTQQVIDHIMYFSKEFAKSLLDQNVDPEVVQYVLPMAYNVRYNMAMNLREAITLIELRSKPEGHISYRTLAQNMYHALVYQYPILKNIIRCNFSNPDLGRLTSENKNADKNKN